MAEIKIKVSIAIAVKDSLNDTNELKGNIYVKTENGVIAKKINQSCYVFINLPKGKHKFIIESEFYQKYVLESEIDSKFRLIKTVLIPNRSYPFKSDVVKIYGKLKKGKTATVIPCKSMGLLIENAVTCSEKIKIFCSNNKNLSGKKLLFTNDRDINDIYMLSKSKEETIEYTLDKPIINNLSASFSIFEVYDITGDENGNYFIAINSSIEKVMFIKERKKITTEVLNNEIEYNFTEE